MQEMQSYMGFKAIQATPMTLGDYNAHRGWEMPANEDPYTSGYLVEYESGYQTWSPADAFEDAYRLSGQMSFGMAVEALKAGKKVARSGWNGKGMFLFLVPGSTFTANRPPLLGIYPEGTSINYHAHIDMKTADDKFVPWLASQTDVLAEDWSILP